MKWERLAIEDLCLKVTSGGTPLRSRTEFYEGGTIPWIKTKEVNFNRIYDADEKITEKGLDNSSAKLIPENSILIAMYGDGHTAGRCAINRLPVTTNQACCNLVINPDKANPDYMFYKITTLYEVFKGLKSGGSQQNLNAKTLKEFQVQIPPLPTQRRIASILSAYDDLIENNLKRIKLLEEKAILRYKGIVKSEKVVEKKLNQVTQFLKRGISPKYVNDEGVVVLNQKCIRNHIVSFEDSRLTDSEKSIPKERMLQKYDTLINSTGTGTLGRIAMNIQDEFLLTTDSHITIVRANHEITPVYLCMSLFAMENVIEMMGEGATNQTELSPKKVGEEIKIPLISNTLMNEYEKEAMHIFNLIWNLQNQNAKLREARDILLPKLMNGQIEV